MRRAQPVRHRVARGIAATVALSLALVTAGAAAVTATAAELDAYADAIAVEAAVEHEPEVADADAPADDVESAEPAPEETPTDAAPVDVEPDDSAESDAAAAAAPPSEAAAGTDPTTAGDPASTTEVDHHTTGAPAPPVALASTYFPSPWPGASLTDDGFDDDTWFSGWGTSEERWQGWTTGGANNSDADLGRVWFHTPSADAQGDVWTNMAFNRRTNSGSVSFRVELNQAENAGGGHIPTRTDGDLLLLFSQTGGDTPHLVDAFRWEWAGGSWPNQWRPLSVAGTAQFLQASQTQTVSQIELNLSALFAQQTGGNVCTGGYVVANIRTATTHGLDATLRDWVRPIPISTPATCEATLEVTKLVQPWNSDVAVPAAGWVFDASAATAGFPLVSPERAVTGDDGVAAPRFVLRADAPTHRGSLTVTEQLPAGYAMTGVSCPSLPEGRTLTYDLTTGRFAVEGIAVDDALRCTVVNRAPRPLDASAQLQLALTRGWDWTIDKTVSGENLDARNTVRAVPGAGDVFDYELVVAATQRPDADVVATAVVTLTNDAAVARTLEGVEVRINGLVPDAVTADGVPVTAATVVPAGDALVLTVTHAFDVAPDAVAVTVTGIDGTVSLPAAITAPFTHGPRVTVTEVDREALVRDSFPEFAQAYPELAQRVLDATEGTSEWTFTYSARRGETVRPGGCRSFVNAAAVGPVDGGRPFDTARQTVRVCTGLPLTVAVDPSADAYHSFQWSLEKLVRDTVTGEWVAATTIPAGADGRADVDFRVVVTPQPATLSARALAGSVTVTNPNRWDVDIEELVISADVGPHATAVCAAAVGAPGTVAAGGAETVAFTCAVDGSPDVLASAVTATVTWDAAAAASATGTASASGDPIVWRTEFVNCVIDVWDDKAGTEDVPFRLHRYVANEDGELERRYAAVWNPHGIPTVFEYSVPLDVGAHRNVAWIDGLPDQDGSADVEVITFDVALRTWVSEVWRDGEPVFYRYGTRGYTGPERVIPHTTYDDEDVDIEPGDVLVLDVVVFNQGDHPVRVDELAATKAAGLTPSDIALGDADHGDRTWGDGPDGLWSKVLDGDGNDVVELAPGASYELHLQLLVTDDALADDVDEVELYTFVQVYRLSGWVPQHDVAAAADGVAPATAAGAWVPGVYDVDSPMGRVNLAAGVNGVLDTARWIDNEIHHGGTGIDGDDDVDNHDGHVMRVVRATYRDDRDPAGPPDETPGETPAPTPAPPAPAATPGRPGGAAPAVSAPNRPGVSQLPVTGAEAIALAVAAALAVGLGGWLTVVRRRRRGAEQAS